jgi:hypothetical protein
MKFSIIIFFCDLCVKATLQKQTCMILAVPSENFIKAEQKAWRKWLKRAPSYDPDLLGIVPGSRGVVLTGPSKSVPAVIMTALLLRETGCNLPIQFSYLKNEVTEVDLKVVRYG